MTPSSPKSPSSRENDDTSLETGKTRGSFQREPPVVPERVAVLKANYKQAWLYFLIGVCLIVAWGGMIRFAFIRAFAVENNDDIPRTSSTFMAVAYEGISESEKEVTPERFSDQIEHLAEAGYNTITLQDVKAFYEEGILFPEKALLLTFDHSRKSSYFDARRVLKDYGWRAVMFVWTKPILDEDPAALRWPYIRAMINSGSWEAGAQSHLGFDQIPSDSEGQLSNFLTSPQWLTTQNRYETPQEYEARLRADHQYVTNLIEEETNQEPVAFAFPYGDFGQYDERALLTRRLNMDLVSEFYDLGFILGNAGLNTKFTNPLRLNRLLVKPDWDGEELLSRIEVSWPQELGVDTQTLLSEKKRWQHDWGSFELEQDKLILEATENNTGAKVWITGTDLYRDFSAEFKLNIHRGQAGIFLRASKDGESHIYLGLGDAGEVWLRQKMPGMESITLGTSRFEPLADGTVELQVYARGDQFFVSSGTVPLFKEIIITRGEDTPGLIGLSVWDPEVSVAHLEFQKVEARPFHNRLITWTPISTHLPYLAGWMNKNGYQYSMLAPPWLKFGLEGRAEQLGWNSRFYKDLANVYNMDFVPEIIIERSESIDDSTAENIAERAFSHGADAVYCNLSRMSGGLNIAKVTSWLEKISEALSRKGIELVVSLPPTLQRGTSIDSLLLGLEDMKIVLPENILLEQSEFQPNNPRVVTWNHALIEQTDQPLFFQLSGTDAEEELWSNEVRSRLLWEEGIEAYDEGKFDLAIDLWTRWSKVEPYNEKPPRFIGDAHRIQQEFRPAVEYYQRSLELNPGQISLVLTTAKILYQFTNDTAAAREMLNLYGRLFPDNSEITLATADLLLSEGDRVGAGNLIKKVIKNNPGDLNALSLLHGLLETPQERVENLEKILDVGRKVGMYTHFANAISNFDLLVWPESWRLINLVAKRAEQNHPESALYKRLLPRETVVRETFQFGSLSDQWENSSHESEDGKPGDPLYLQASPTRTEAALQLKGSNTMQTGFIEGELDEARGFFWLYARRSEGNMIRFGYETGGKLYLQIWLNDEIVTNMSREWLRPSGHTRLRLEIRGDAAFGFVDGEPAFGAPIQIPTGLNLGWWGMAPWSARFGVAQAVVKEVAGGPLPIKIAIFQPKTNSWTDESIVEKVKENTHALSVLSPAWFIQEPQGRVRPIMDLDFPRTRLFSRYYKIRLYPMILSAIPQTLDMKGLIDLARSSNVDGFTLTFARMPNEEWFEMAEEVLVGSKIGIIAMQVDSTNEIVNIRELGASSSLQSGARKTRQYSLKILTGIENPIIRLEEPQPSLPMLRVENDPEQKTGTNPKSSVVSFPVENTVYVF